MKIVNGSCIPYIAVKCIGHGGPFRFKHCLAQKHKVDDVFLVVEVCSSYRPGDYKGRDNYSDKMPVVNVRTGALAYVSKDRPCYRINAEVCVGESL